MNINNQFPSNYIKSSDLGGMDQSVTIRGVATETVGQGRNAKQVPVLYFAESDKGMVLNKTNAGIISDVLGTEETDEWIGKRITLYVADVEYQGEIVDGIRVRRPGRGQPPAAGGGSIGGAVFGGRQPAPPSAQPTGFGNRQPPPSGGAFHQPAGPQFGKPAAQDYESQVNALFGAPPASQQNAPDYRTETRALFDKRVAEYNASGEGAQPYANDEADAVYRKIMSAMFPGRAPSSLSPEEWQKAQQAIAKEFSPATRDLIPF